MCVRSSIAFYGNFNLDMDRSPGFGSTLTDYGALLRLGFPSAPHLEVLNLASQRNSPDRSTKVRGSTYKVVPQFVNTGFQVLFHSPPGVLFTFPSQYYALSVTKEYLALGVVPPTSRKVSRVSRYFGSCSLSPAFVYGGFHPLWLAFPKPFY